MFVYYDLRLFEKYRPIICRRSPNLGFPWRFLTNSVYAFLATIRQNGCVFSVSASTWCQFVLLLVMLILITWLGCYLPAISNVKVVNFPFVISILWKNSCKYHILILLPTNWQTFMVFVFWVFPPWFFTETIVSLGFAEWWFFYFHLLFFVVQILWGNFLLHSLFNFVLIMGPCILMLFYRL